MDDPLYHRSAAKQSRAARLLGLPAAAAPPGDPLRQAPPEPAPPPPDPPSPASPRPAGRVPAGPRQPAPTPGDFIGALIRRSRRY